MGRMMRSRALCAGLALTLATACSGGAKPRAHNVLLVTIDTLRADALGAYGSQSGATPHLDELAARGVLFEQAHASAPNTLPSHASILTGLHPYHHRVRENGVNSLAESHVVLAQRFSAAGYATGAEVAAVVLARGTGIAHGFDHFQDTESPGVALQQIRVESDGSLDDPSAVTGGDAKVADLHTRGAADITRAGIAFVREHRGAPFFLWLHYYDPHWPYAPPAPYAARFSANRYAGEVAAVDESLAQVTRELEQLGLAESTLLVVTGDHGEGLGDHGESRHSYLVYQATMHVPLLFVGPGVPAGRRVATPVQTVDIAPTILAWAGLEPTPSSDGASLLPAFAGQDLPQRVVYGESVSLRRLFDVSPLRFVREGRWKLVHKPIPELYDLDVDPAEANNRAGDESSRVTELRGQLETLLAGVGKVADAKPGQLDEKTRQQLESLGYVVGGSTPSDDPSLDTAEVHGTDPTQLIAKIDPYVGALGTTQFTDAKQTSILLEQLSRQVPESSAILELLVDTQLAGGLTEPAIASLRRGIEIDPEHQRYWDSLGELLTGLARDREAREVLGSTLKRWPCDIPSRTRLATVLLRTGARAEQIALLEQGIAACDSPPELVNDLAYQLATVPSAKLRNGKRALELAQEMIQSLGDNPLALDTLAVAQAEAGKHDDAQSTLARALELAEQQRLPDAALAVLRDHAAKIGAGQPIRE